ncbi:MAG TPA: response regulator transcription factor [Devosiaceae bacterium]|jgi:two-component system OmpR family response regulator
MNATRPRISIVEDDPEIRRLLLARLEKEDFRVDAANGGAGFDRLVLSRGFPDLVILDIMLPGEDGFSICRRIRAQSRVPIIMLTARGDDIDRIVGLELGADDYVAKPFNPRELVARIRAILRRIEPLPLERERYRLGPLEVDISARAVVLATGETVDLTAGEFDLLGCFLSRPQRVLSREQLIEWTRGRDADPFDRTIDVQMSRLRRKLTEAGADGLFKTIRNAGYILTESVRL